MELMYHIPLLFIFLFIDYSSCLFTNNDPLSLNDQAEAPLYPDEEFQGNERGFLNKKGTYDVNLNFNIILKGNEKQTRGSSIHEAGYEDSINWKIDSTRTTPYSNLERDRELREINFNQFSTAYSMKVLENMLPSYPENSKIWFKFYLVFNRFLILIEKDKKQNSIPLAFYNFFFSSVGKYLKYSNKGETNKILNNILKFPNLRYNIQRLIGISKLEGDFSIYKLYNNFKNMLEKLGLEYNKENRKLVKGYKEIMKNFAKIVNEDLNGNIIPVITTKFITDNGKEIIHIFDNMINLQSRLFKIKINHSSSFLEHLDKYLMNNRKGLQKFQAHGEL